MIVTVLFLNLSYFSNNLLFTHHDGVHSVPKIEIYVDDQLNFALRCLLWSLPAKHELYCSYNKSVKNITISNLLHHVSSLKLCSGLSNQYSEACIEHSVPKIFSSNLLSSTSFPLHQSTVNGIDHLIVIS